jgi:calcium permeable stress-gated cation channel
MVNLIGMDATIFMRFTRMCRDMFVILSVIGCCILIPVNITKGVFFENASELSRIGPSNVFGEPHWATVVVAWLFNIVVAGFLWWNYRKVLQLRRQYFESEEYQHSLHARTLMVRLPCPEHLGQEGRLLTQKLSYTTFRKTWLRMRV